MKKFFLPYGAVTIILNHSIKQRRCPIDDLTLLNLEASGIPEIADTPKIDEPSFGSLTQSLGDLKKKSIIPEAIEPEALPPPSPPPLPTPKNKLTPMQEKLMQMLRSETSDTIDFRKGCPGLPNNLKLKENIEFLTDESQSRPLGDYISNIHKNWMGQYDKLETHHGYIQWLFPIRTPGLKNQSHGLQQHEINFLLDNYHKKNTQANILKSLELMLDFYGIKLMDNTLMRSENYKERYDNLIKNSHNNLRITRILKCLAEFELEPYQLALIKYLIQEICVVKELEELVEPLYKYWVHTIKDDRERKDVISYLEDLTPIAFK